MYKLEGKFSLKHNEYNMTHRVLLDKINYEEKTIIIDGNIYTLEDTDFPTIDKNNPYKLTDEDIDYIKNFDVVICDVWGKVEGQFKELKEKGIVTAFDCATSPDSEESVKAIPYTDYLFYSVDTGDTKEVREQMERIQKQGPKLVICMMGEEGSLCYDGERYHRFGIVPCDHLVDSMGAGDSYIAGFLTGIVDGLSIEGAMEKGAANATETLKYFGAW